MAVSVLLPIAELETATIIVKYTTVRCSPAPFTTNSQDRTERVRLNDLKTQSARGVAQPIDALLLICCNCHDRTNYGICTRLCSCIDE